MSDGVEIVVGTYSEWLLGYKVVKSGDDIRLVQSFSTHAHLGSVKSVASMGRYLASGASDDKVIIHDMKRRVQDRELMHHDGTVNAVAFAGGGGGSHVISASADGAITVTQIGNWLTEKHWAKAHKGSAVTGIAIHPSNKLALTIGDDHTLRTWNLVKGRQAYVINLASKGAADPLSVVWSPGGEHFSLTGYNDVSVWSISNAAVKHVLKCPSKSICMAWITETVTAVGLENGEIMVFDIESGKTAIFPTDTQRIKEIAHDNGYIFTVSSSGHIKVWKYKPSAMELKEKCCLETGSRITCMTLVKLCNDIKKEPIINKIDLDSTSKKRSHEDISNETEAKSTLSEEIKRSCIPYVTITMDDDDDAVDDKLECVVANKKPKKKIKTNNKKNSLKKDGKLPVNSTSMQNIKLKKKK